MAAPIISPQTTFDVVLGEGSFTVGELQSHPLAAPFTAQFDAFLASWAITNAARTALLIALGKAEGAVYGADDALDDFVDLLDRTLLIATKNDRKAALYLLYFAIKTANLLKRPILGDELATVRAWIPSLQGSPTAAIAALAPVLVGLVAAADTAVAQRTAAEQALKEFDTVGGKKTLIDAFNTLRQTVYGQLAALPHQHPDAMLPATFADRFFRHTSHKGITALTNAKDVQSKIDALKSELAAAEAHLATLAAATEKKLADKAAEKVKADSILQAKKDADAAQQKVKALEKTAKAGKKPA